MKSILIVFLFVIAFSDAQARCGPGTRCLRIPPKAPADDCSWGEAPSKIEQRSGAICMGGVICVPKDGAIIEQVAICYVEESENCTSAQKCAESDSVSPEAVDLLATLRNSGQLKSNVKSGGSR